MGAGKNLEKGAQVVFTNATDGVRLDWHFGLRFGAIISSSRLLLVSMALLFVLTILLVREIRYEGCGSHDRGP